MPPFDTNDDSTLPLAPIPIRPGQTLTHDGQFIHRVPALDGSRLPYFIDSRGKFGPMSEVSKYHPTTTTNATVESPLDADDEYAWNPDRLKAYRKTPGRESPSELFHLLLNAFSKYFVARSPHHQVVLALYVMMTYVFGTSHAVPYLMLVGDPGSGKSVVGELLHALAYRAMLAASLTPAAIYRLLARSQGTIIIDEQSSGTDDWESILKVGYRSGGRVYRADPRSPDGLLSYDCFGPKVVLSNALIRTESLESRFLVLHVDRTEQRVQRFRPIQFEPQASLLRSRLYAFSLGHGEEIARLNAKGIVPAALNGREAELAELLFSVATVVDAADGSSGARDGLLAFFAETDRRRTETRLTEAPQFVFARALLNYIENVIFRTDDGEELHLAESVTAYAKQNRLIPGDMLTKQFGQRLRQYGFIKTARVIDVELGDDDLHIPSNESMRSARGRRVQKTAWSLDVQRIQAAASVGSKP